MRLSMPLLWLLALPVGAPAVAHAQAQAPELTPAEREVYGVFQDFLSAMLAKDSVRLARHIDSTTRFTLLRPTPQGTRVWAVSGQEFLNLVLRPDSPALDEPTRNPVIQIDSDLATVWAEYQVVMNGTVSHCGYDAVHLARINGQWKILNVSDTFRRQGCGADWKAGG